MENADAGSSEEPHDTGAAKGNTALKKAEERLSELEQELKETEDLFNSRLVASVSEHARAHQSLDSQRLLEREQIENLE